MAGVDRVAFFALLLAGCFPASYTIETPLTPPIDPSAAVRADAAQVCVVREAGSLFTYVVHDNGHLVGATRGPGFFCYDVRPGLHRVTSEVAQDSVSVDITVARGERVFVRQSVETPHTLTRVTDAEGRSSMRGAHYEQLVAGPEVVAPPSTVVESVGSLPSEPPPPPVPVRRRPNGLTYGGAATVGVGLSGTGAARQSAETGLAALGSIWVGFSGYDWVVVALRIDAGVVHGDTLGAIGVHVALYPGAHRPGPIGDLLVFADAGVGGPLATSTDSAAGSPALPLGRIGVAWERGRLGPLRIGPTFTGQVVRGSGLSQVAALIGVEASIHPGGTGR